MFKFLVTVVAVFLCLSCAPSSTSKEGKDASVSSSIILSAPPELATSACKAQPCAIVINTKTGKSNLVLLDGSNVDLSSVEVDTYAN